MKKESETIKLTPLGCLYAAPIDYGIDVSKITPRIGECMVNDFVEAMVKNGNTVLREESNQRKIKAKNIDILDVKQAIKDGQLEIVVEHNPFSNNYSVYLKDRITGESVLLFVTETSETLKMPK